MDNYTEMYSLTHPQKGIWYIEKLHPHTSFGNIAGTVRITGEVDYRLLEKAINIVLEKNDALRLRVTESDGEPLQYFEPYSYTRLDYLDFSTKPIEELYEWDQHQTRRPLKLTDSSLSYFALIRISDNEGGFYLKLHHLISDAWTMVLTVNEIIEYYWDLKNGVRISDEKKPSYAEYVQREQSYLASPKFSKDREFWNARFRVPPEVTNVKNVNTAGKSTEAKRKTFIIPESMADGLRRYCEDNKLSIFMLFLAMLAIYINRVTSKRDLVIGTPVLNRSNAREKNTLGMFVSTIPVRISVDDGMDFTSFVQSVSKEWMQLLRHYEYPYEVLIKDVREMHKSVENLYDIILSYQNAKLAISEFMGSYKARWHFNGYQKDSLIIHINERDNDGNLVLDFDFLSEIFSYKEIEYVHKHMLSLMKDAIANPGKKLYELDIMDAEEKRRVLYSFNGIKTPYPQDKTFQQLFEEQVERTPDKTAVVFENSSLTYRELNERANKLAGRLIKEGIGPDSIVAIMVKRSLEMPVGILGILKAGGAYLPIDPEYPEERVRFILEDSGARVLLTNRGRVGKAVFAGKTIDLDDAGAYTGKASNPCCHNSPESLGYVIYTSGSTGLPKGVMLKRKGLNNLFKAVTGIMDFTPGKTVISVTTVSFDIFIFEALLPLLKGMKVVIANEEEQRIPRLLKEAMLKNKVDVIQTTPSRMQLFINDEDRFEHFKALSDIVLGGEAFPQKLMEKLKKITKARIFNGYGPTETTVYSTFKELTYAKTVDIGKPVANTYTYILDEHLNPVPVGIPGELHIGGEGVAREYLNRPELNEQKFIPNPFRPGERMFKTGDLARWYPNGDIEYLGRIDHQVKIRGLRIELGEIENQILKFTGIKKAVVIDREDSQGKKYLCAYLLSEGAIPFNDLRAFLSRLLPGYMIPSYFVRIDSIPLTPNGKIDRSALPEPDMSAGVSSEYVAPTNEIEEKLLDIWCKVLGLERIGINDDFFELGGDSLNLVSVITRIHKIFDVEIPLTEIYKSPTIKELGEYIALARKSIFVSVRPVAESDYYPVSSAQKRLFVLAQLENGSIAYNMPGARLLEGRLDVKRFEDALKGLISRHEALRTTFEIIGGEPVQRIAGEADFAVDYYDGTKSDPGGIIKGFIRPFDLGKAPLLRIGLVKVAEDRHILLFDMHHIISDGKSLEILLRELNMLYMGEELPPLKIHYKDFSAWQNDLLKSGYIRKQEKYWLKAFSGELPVLNMPSDYPRPAVQSYEGSAVNFKLSRELTDRIKKAAAQTDSTVFMLLLAAYNVLLSKYTGQEDIVVGTPVAGRRHVDVESLVGIFVNTLALRNYPSYQKRFIDFLGEVKDNTLNAIENQDYQFEELVTRLRVKRDLGRNPLFDTMFVLQPADTESLKIGDLRITPYELQNPISKFDISLEAVERDGELNFRIEYCTRLFSKETISRLAAHYENIIRAVTGNLDIMLSQIGMLSREEQHRLVSDFNNTAAEYRKDMTIHQLFEEQAERTPDEAALVFHGESLTYRQLNEKANQLARVLRDKGVGRDSIVGVLLKRSLELVISILAIIKAGGAYLPLDPDYPQKRINYMLEDSHAGIIITHKGLDNGIIFRGDSIDLDKQDVFGGSSSNLPNKNKPDDLIYVIYTSGSTGLPKGVMLTHKSVNNFIKGVTDKIDFGSGKTILCVTTISFDIFVLETLLPLTKGLKIVIADEEEQRTPRLLSELVFRHGIDMMQMTPSRMQLLLSDDSSVSCLKIIKDLMIGGEVFPGPLLARLNKLTSARIFNMYGPTETTVWSTLKELTGKESITIGKAIANTNIYILDRSLNLLPVGVPGELYIGGDGLARGYLNNPELTEKRFLPDPYRRESRIYKTGDLARILPSGEIDCLGRIDHQVKIRGFRIELGEIENKILSSRLVKETVVVDREDANGNKYLCAYIVLDDEDRDVAADLRKYLSEELPDYMVPSNIIRLNYLPLTPNGKVDRKELPAPDKAVMKSDKYEAPRNKTEENIAKIWSEVLNIERIGIRDNFFELGGDSLAIIQVQTKAFHYGWNISAQDFYKYQTIGELSEIVLKAKNKESRKRKGRDISIDLLERSFTEAAASGKLDHLNGPGCGSILLTGSTGFLGIHLLGEIISGTGSDVYCLVRRQKDKTSQERLSDLFDFYFQGKYKDLINKRIFIINGDLTGEKFGLDGAAYSELGRNIDTVIHAAANVNHIGEYGEFHKTNVLGTERVVDFCLKFGKTLHHISTMSVLDDYSDNVYVRSKIEAEKAVFAAGTAGLKASVYRIGNLTGRYSDGQFQVNIGKNAFYNRLRSIIRLNAVSHDLLKWNIEFTPVDFCSSAIIKMVQKNVTGRILHVFNHNYINLAGLVEIFSSLGIEVKTLEKDSFNEYLSAISRDSKKHDMLAGIVQDLDRKDMLESKFPMDGNTGGTKVILDSIGFKWPPVDRDYVNKVIGYMKRCGYLL